MVGELIMRCLHGRTNAHVLHLKTPSYAKHKALNEFYDDVIPLVDSIAEMVQDDADIDSFPARYTPVDDPIALVRSLRDWLRDHRYECCDPDETEVQNVIDEVIGLCRTTLYKLRKLK